MEPVHVLMVCLGNICRSPLAEGVLRNEAGRQGLSERIEVDSAGTANYHVNALPDPRSIKTALKHGIELQHRGRQFISKDFRYFDYILVMDRSNYDDVIRMAKSDEEKAKVRLFGEFDPARRFGIEVPDPYYGDLEDFEKVYEQCLACAQGFLKFVQQNHFR